MSFAAWYDPRLPEPSRQRGGRCRRDNTDADYAEYYQLYQRYVQLRGPFLNKPDCIPDARAPNNPASGEKPIPAWDALLEKERPFLTPAQFTALQGQTVDIERTYNEDWRQLNAVIEELAWCNYVHSFGPPSETRILANNGNVAFVDYTCATCLFPPPGCQTMQADYVNHQQVGYDAKTHTLTDQTGAAVQQYEAWSPIPDGVALPDSISQNVRMPPGSVPITLQITKSATVAQRYRSLLWAAIKGQ